MRKDPIGGNAGRGPAHTAAFSPSGRSGSKPRGEHGGLSLFTKTQRGGWCIEGCRMVSPSQAYQIPSVPPFSVSGFILLLASLKVTRQLPQQPQLQWFCPHPEVEK